MLPQVTSLLEQMDARDRVGQLFLVSFVGDTAAIDTFIAELISTYRIGGVTLLAANDNITDELDPPTQISGLLNELQTQAYEASQDGSESSVEEIGLPSPFIPLFVAIDHEGDGPPFTRISRWAY